MKRALVTGATSGIGEALAHLLAKEGIPLILAGRNEEKLQELRRTLPVAVQTVTCDLCDSKGRIALVAAINQLKPDLVINNAGAGLYGEAAELPLHRQLELVELNVTALTEITLSTVSLWRREHLTGTVMNISSAAAFQIAPCFAVYSATKTYVNQFSQSLDYELKEHGIRVLSACPGIVRTHFRENAGGRERLNESLFSMSSEFAAEEILNQVRRGRGLRIFDWRYRLLTRLGKLCPTALSAYLMKCSLQQIKAGL